MYGDATPLVLRPSLQLPSLALLENITRAGGNAAAAPFQDDPDWDEVCRRGLAVTTLQNWYLMPSVTNQLFDEE